MPHNRNNNSSGHKPSDLTEQIPPPDVESTEGGPRGREIIPDAVDEPQARDADEH